MTPNKARDLLDGTTPGPWFFDDDMAGTVHTIGPIVPAGTEIECTTDDAALAAHAPDMAAMIAGMREEWGVEERHEYTGEWSWHSTHPDRESACNAVNGMDHFRVARRYVTTPEEIS